jgi:GT2 family glycosyltransferase
VADQLVVSVVIPTHQRREALRRALSSLSRQTVARDSYEVIVSVDRSTDGTREMVEAFAAPYPLRVVACPGPGRAAACNAGLELVRGEAVIVLDDDMEVIPEFIECHRRHHRRGSRLCVLGAVPVRLDSDSPLAARYVAAKFAAHLTNLAEPDHVFVPRDFYSGNTSLRSEVMREVGGFDESFAVYGNEDVELSVRLRAAGVSLRYDPAALAHQEYDKDLRALARDTREKGRSAVMLARAHPEIFDALRLSAPRDASRPWLVARAVLLYVTRHWRRADTAVFALARVLERAGLWREPLFYRALLDYAFWAGVDSALCASADRGELERLAVELHRGPVDLLLHR